MKPCHPRRGGFKEPQRGRAGQVGPTHMKPPGKLWVLGWGAGPQGFPFLAMPNPPAEGAPARSWAASPVIQTAGIQPESSSISLSSTLSVLASCPSTAASHFSPTQTGGQTGKPTGPGTTQHTRVGPQQTQGSWLTGSTPGIWSQTSMSPGPSFSASWLRGFEQVTTSLGLGFLNEMNGTYFPGVW